MSLTRDLDLLGVFTESCRLPVQGETNFTAIYDPCSKPNRVSLTLLSQRFGCRGDLFEHKKVAIEWYLKGVPGWTYRSEFEVVKNGTFQVIFRNNSSFSSGCPNPFLQMESMVLAVSALRRAMRLFRDSHQNAGLGKRRLFPVEDDTGSPGSASPIAKQPSRQEHDSEHENTPPAWHITPPDIPSENVTETAQRLQRMIVSSHQQHLPPPNTAQRNQTHTGLASLSDPESVFDRMSNSVFSTGTRPSTASQTTDPDPELPDETMNSPLLQPTETIQRPLPCQEFWPSSPDHWQPPFSRIIPPHNGPARLNPPQGQTDCPRPLEAWPARDPMNTSQTTTVGSPGKAPSTSTCCPPRGDQDMELGSYGDSDDDMMDPDRYWTWNEEIQKFYHLDEEDGEVVYYPEEFD
ncbi:hypothetical protein MKZ38_000373 [Zalerion maritima]|uniref:Uncharacterized protein n=1 Tax=Zalerion maritima TaxID=339359 RepID=A0AAD5WN39_9PEZI|nr:hypothetical protein MKZ38_000373 [Zalerion maritima]